MPYFTPDLALNSFTSVRWDFNREKLKGINKQMIRSISFILLLDKYPKEKILCNTEIFFAKEAEVENIIMDSMKQINKSKNDLLGVINLNIAHIKEFMKIESLYRKFKL